MTYNDGLIALADALDGAVDECTHLDAVAGDGDLGLTLGKIAEAIRSSLVDGEVVPSDHLKAVGLAVAKAAPSTFGTLVATGFLRAAPAVQQADSDQAAIAAALRAAEEGIAARGKAERGQRTALDALGPAADAFADAPDLASAWRAAAVAATEGAAATAQMQPIHGRAGWIAERARGNPDAGATAIAIAISGVAARLT
jgi:dihydroxyacetone kinase-like protein